MVVFELMLINVRYFGKSGDVVLVFLFGVVIDVVFVL